MVLCPLVVLAFFLQEPEQLETGKPVAGVIGEESVEIHAPFLDLFHGMNPAFGEIYQISVAETGPYFIELHSLDFNSYLVLADENGVPLAEDEDEYIGVRARLVTDLEARHKYFVYAAALHGNRGRFELQLSAGKPNLPTREQELIEGVAYWKARVEHSKATLGEDHASYALALNGLGRVLRKQGKYSEARLPLEKGLAIRERALGPEHWQTADSLDNVGMLHEVQGEYPEAKRLYEQSLAIKERALGPDHPGTATTVNFLAILLEKQGNFQGARPLYERALKTREKALGPEHLDTANSFNNYGAFLCSLGRYEEARPMYERALAIREKGLGPDHPDVASSLNNLGLLLKNQGKYDQARPLYERSLSIKEKVLGPDDLSVATSLNNLAMLIRVQGNDQEAQPLMERSLQIREKVQGLEHPSVANSLNNYARLLMDQGKYEEARPMFERALAIREKTLGPEHPSTAVSLNNLARFLRIQGNFVEALPLFERALGIAEKVLGPDHPDTARSLNSLGYLLKAQGKYREAMPFIERSLAICEKVLGAEHADTAAALGNLGTLYQSLGFFEQARPLMERSLTIREKAFGPDHPKTAISLNNLATLYVDQGNSARARSLYERALDIDRRVLGEEHPSTATSMANLAGLLKDQGQYEEAQVLYEQSLRIKENAFGPEHPGTASGLQSLASILREQKEFNAARPLYERAIAIQEKSLGPDHPHLSTYLNNYALNLEQLGEFDLARARYEQSFAIAKKTLGPQHPSLATGLSNMARLLEDQGHIDQARSLLVQSLSTTLALLDQELPTLNEAERFQLLDVTYDPSRLLSCLKKSETQDLVPEYALFQQWKGKATRLQLASIRLSRLDSDPKIRGRKGEIQVAAKKLSRLVLLPLAKQAPDHSKQIDRLRQLRLSLERELNLELGLDWVLTTPGLKRVQTEMPEDSVLLDFFVGDQVYAWVLAPQGKPGLVPLGAKGPLREAQNAFLGRHGIRGGKLLEDTSSATSGGLLSALWEPLKMAVGESATVFVSPDGFLCELPFGMLQESDGQFLLEKHRFVYLADPTSLASDHRVLADAEGSLLAVGGVNYFRREDPGETHPLGVSTRSNLGSSWDSLPATRLELQSLRDLHNSVLEWESPMTAVEGKAATEERIRAELPGKRYVHIATHGYFEPDHLPSLLLDAEEKQSKAELGEQVKAVGLLPGLLSGLVFAGVNGEPDPTRDDGYLCAEEIQHLDLSACDLVVLSACETALGSARAGEGLMSLRRAFSVAGADTVISSLWKVDDQATARLMKDFYTNLWQAGMSRSEALHQAKLRTLRRNRIEHEGDAMPMTWGAFVLSGQWN